MADFARRFEAWAVDTVPAAGILTCKRPDEAEHEMTGFLTRWTAAFVLLACTFNPTQYNYLAWVRTYGTENLSIAVLVGLLIVVGYIIFLRATLRSIGTGGMTLLLAIAGAFLWVLHDVGLLSFDDPEWNLWLGIAALSFVLGVGLNWSHVRRALSGQSDMDDVGDEE